MMEGIEMSKGMRTLRRLTLFILDYWWVMCLGMLLTAWLIDLEYDRRGYFAIGGEWFILPAMIGARRFVLFLKEGGLWDIWRS